VLWGGTHALRTWWGILLLGGLLALGIAALERQLEAEAVLEQAGAAATNGSSPPEHPSTAEEIDRLVELRRSGAITNEEFERAKTIALT
jgi:multidrug resistance efflux pump